jgi:hypothetical protein
MTVVSTKEFNTNQKKYFDMAVDEQVYIKRGDYMFHITCSKTGAVKEQAILEPDDDLRRAITAEELKKRMHISIRNFFANKQ